MAVSMYDCQMAAGVRGISMNNTATVQAPEVQLV